MTQETNKNEMIVIAAAKNPVAVVTRGLFDDIDFSGISAAIEKIAQSNGQMSVEEKEMANGIVDQWQKDVIDRLYGRSNEMSRFIKFFEVSPGDTPNRDKLEDFGLELAQK